MAKAIKPVLCVLTSNPIKGKAGVATGFMLSELTHPLAVLKDAGIPTVLASIRGGQPPIDGFDLSDAVNARFWQDADFREQLATTPSLDCLDASDYSAVFFVGGHGTMWDFPDSKPAQHIIRDLYENGGIVSAVCHGPAALVNAKLTDGSYLVAGKNLAAFTDEEEAEAHATEIVPFLLATTLKQYGGLHHAAPNWHASVVVDGRLITGQNPASAHGVGEAIRDALIASVAPRHSALTPAEVASVAPALLNYTGSKIVGELWERPGLSKKDRCVATLSALIARNQTIGMLHYFNKSLDEGLTPAELSELITHMAFYCGWPNAFFAVEVLKDIFAERGIGSDQLPEVSPKLLSLAECVPDDAFRVGFIAQNVAPVSAGLQHFTDDLLYHQVWLRPGLAPRLRNLATITALISTGQGTYLPFYLNRAVLKGVTKDNVSELFAHLAFYSGWPMVMASTGVVKEYFDNNPAD